MAPTLDASPAAPRKSGDQGDHKHYQEQKEQQLRDPGSRYCDPTETKYCGDYRHNQKNQRPVKHVASSGVLRTKPRA
jgi:hypothetical protein